MTSTTVVRALLVLVSASVLAGCGGDAVELGAAQPSGVQGFPVPQAAVLVTERGPAGLSEGSETWETPGVDGADLVAWYDQELPAGQAVQDLGWCSRDDSGESVWHYYVDAVGERDASVSVFPRESPPKVLLNAGEAVEPC